MEVNSLNLKNEVLIVENHVLLSRLLEGYLSNTLNRKNVRVTHGGSNVSGG